MGKVSRSDAEIIAIRRFSEDLADKVADLLGIAPEDVSIEGAFGRVSLTNEQLAELLLRVQ